jgi:hypothetical protein
MTTLQEQHAARVSARVPTVRERRQYRRHDFEHQAITLERWDGARGLRQAFGKIVDLSAGGVRVRTTARDGNINILPDQQIRVRMELPAYAGICPFVDTSTGQPQPRREWTGWMAVARVTDLGNGEYEISGRLVDMEEMDRGMLKLYLSTQPLAA